MPLTMVRTIYSRHSAWTLVMGTLLAFPLMGDASQNSSATRPLRETKPSRSTDCTSELARRRAACGFNCLYLLLRFSNKEIDTRQLGHHLTISETGNSILSLKRASHQLGVPGTIIRAGVSDLQHLDMPLILLANSHHIDEVNSIEVGQPFPDFQEVGHYFLVTSASPDKVEMIDGTTGECLVFSTSDLPSNWVQAIFVTNRTYYTKWSLLIGLAFSLSLLTLTVHWRYQPVR